MAKKKRKDDDDDDSAYDEIGISGLIYMTEMAKLPGMMILCFHRLSHLVVSLVPRDK